MRFLQGQKEFLPALADIHMCKLWEERFGMMRLIEKKVSLQLKEFVSDVR